ncbi:hypothetical protein AB0K15_28440 [Amycolatopsis sp. NPDC049253]|uniref:hypothetical protein n=1 Tax=Amycolatopsis sp. NPDC049253 TaxID=3155274 RepID=UPI00341E363D
MQPTPSFAWQELDRDLTAARERVAEEDAAAAAGPARLLTADGDDLAHAVQTALETWASP